MQDKNPPNNSNNSFQSSLSSHNTYPLHNSPAQLPCTYLTSQPRRDPGKLGVVYLHKQPIVSLTIDNKERLCLAQISSTLLKTFSYNEIHNRRVALGITCVQCTPVQLEVLRKAGAMPASSRRCGMITKREAERLVHSFLDEVVPPQLPDDFVFGVQHACGWGCRGAFVPSRYNSSRAKCIRCTLCEVFFSPNKFIFHFHRSASSKYNHPDAANFNSWRRHLRLCEEEEEDEMVVNAWEDVKAMFNGGNRRRSQNRGTIKSHCNNNNNNNISNNNVGNKSNNATNMENGDDGNKTSCDNHFSMSSGINIKTSSSISNSNSSYSSSNSSTSSVSTSKNTRWSESTRNESTNESISTGIGAFKRAEISNATADVVSGVRGDDGSLNPMTPGSLGPVYFSDNPITFHNYSTSHLRDASRRFQGLKSQSIQLKALTKSHNNDNHTFTPKINNNLINNNDMNNKRNESNTLFNNNTAPNSPYMSLFNKLQTPDVHPNSTNPMHTQQEHSTQRHISLTAYSFHQLLQKIFFPLPRNNQSFLLHPYNFPQKLDHTTSSMPGLFNSKQLIDSDPSICGHAYSEFNGAPPRDCRKDLAAARREWWCGRQTFDDHVDKAFSPGFDQNSKINLVKKFSQSPLEVQKLNFDSSNNNYEMNSRDDRDNKTNRTNLKAFNDNNIKTCNENRNSEQIREEVLCGRIEDGLNAARRNCFGDLNSGVDDSQEINSASTCFNGRSHAHRTAATTNKTTFFRPFTLPTHNNESVLPVESQPDSSRFPALDTIPPSQNTCGQFFNIFPYFLRDERASKRRSPELDGDFQEGEMKSGTFKKNKNTRKLMDEFKYMYDDGDENYDLNDDDGNHSSNDFNIGGDMIGERSNDLTASVPPSSALPRLNKDFSLSHILKNL